MSQIPLSLDTMAAFQYPMAFGRGKASDYPLLPEQSFTARDEPAQSEKRLLWAVVADAVHCFQTYLFAQKPSERQLFQDAEDWINSTEAEWVFSFENVCSSIGLQAAYLRKGLQSWKAQQFLNKAGDRQLLAS